MQINKAVIAVIAVIAAASERQNSFDKRQKARRASLLDCYPSSG
jgi:hypothetical protein